MDNLQTDINYRVCFATIRAELSRLEDMAADFSNNHPINVFAVTRESTETIWKSLDKLENVLKSTSPMADRTSETS
jgi:hypothetical protein